jgi:2',3'-cyclic-nucleotide 2'-phosphodiesterase (5'-nucleotidase family)
MPYIMNQARNIFFFAILVLFVSCTTKRSIPVSSDDGMIEFTIMQVNDVYEIAPLAAGTQGGMARVATLIDNLEAENSNTISIMSGDFLNPSLLGTMKNNGERIRGKQMVELMNEVGIDLVTFGNHEFDISESDLQKRINESEFLWISSNYDQVCGERNYPFYKELGDEKAFFPKNKVWSIKDSDGTTLSIGFFSATLDVPGIDYLHYMDHTESALTQIEKLEASSDIIVGITHLSIDQDMALAKEAPNVALLLGGHEHDNMIHQVGNVRITKADANAKSAYIHKVTFNKKTNSYSIKSTLKQINEEIALEPNANQLVEKWNIILKKNISAIVDNPFSVIYNTNIPLDGREKSVRHKQTNLGKIISDAMRWSTQGKCDGAIFNSGGIRIDDQLSGEITPVDIFRVLPFGGSIFMVEIKGSLLKKTLDFGSQANGSGAYLQRSNFDNVNGTWQIEGTDIADDQNYWVAMNDYLTLGKDIHFLSRENEGVLQIIKPENDAAKKLRGDIRSAIIQFLKLKK